MSSVTVNGKNHPLGECYLTAYPVTAMSIRMVSNRLHGLGATRIINKQNLTHETPQEVRRELCIKLWICTVFSTKQIILGGDRMLQHPCTTTLIYTPRVQAETDVDDLKIDIWEEKIRWEMKFSMGQYLFRIDGWCLCQVVAGTFTK